MNLEAFVVGFIMAAAKEAYEAERLTSWHLNGMAFTFVDPEDWITLMADIVWPFSGDTPAI
jgi:hypothetical protein